jgi:hypothetical protein
MKALLTMEVRAYFHNAGPTGALWIPTKTRNEIIAEEGFVAGPKWTIHGRVYRINFVSIGGGMWEITMRELNGLPVVTTAGEKV